MSTSTSNGFIEYSKYRKSVTPDLAAVAGEGVLVLGHCWVDGRKGIRSITNFVSVGKPVVVL